VFDQVLRIHVIEFAPLMWVQVC